MNSLDIGNKEASLPEFEDNIINLLVPSKRTALD